MDPILEAAMFGVVVTFASGVGNYVSSQVSAKGVARQRKEDREADWDRQDKVTARVDAVREQAEAAATLLRRNTEEVRQSTLSIMSQQAKIETKVEAVQVLSIKTHGLVNSAMTEVKQSNLNGLIRETEGLRRELLMMNSLGFGVKELEIVKSQIADREAKILELQIEMTDRAAAADLATSDAHDKLDAEHEARIDVRRRLEDLGQ